MISVFVIGGVHVFGVSFFQRFPELTDWLSDFSAGIGLGYAFLYLLPKIGGMSADLATNGKWENSLYTCSLVGFLIYYLLEANRETGTENRFLLGLDTVALGVYNCLLALTIMKTTATLYGLFMIGTLAYSLHIFGVNNYLYENYPRQMSGWLRVYFVAALSVGVLIGLTSGDGGLLYPIATAFIGGVIVALSLRLKLPNSSALDAKALLLGVVFATGAIVVSQN